MWQDAPERSPFVPRKVLQGKSRQDSQTNQNDKFKKNTWALFLKEDHPHTKPKLINVAFWQAQPLYDFAESVDLTAFK